MIRDPSGSTFTFAAAADKGIDNIRTPASEANSDTTERRRNASKREDPKNDSKATGPINRGAEPSGRLGPLIELVLVVNDPGLSVAASSSRPRIRPCFARPRAARGLTLLEELDIAVITEEPAMAVDFRHFAAPAAVWRILHEHTALLGSLPYLFEARWITSSALTAFDHKNVGRGAAVIHSALFKTVVESNGQM